MSVDDVQLRILAAAILFRASLRALTAKPTAQQKMALHARAEETAWTLEAEVLREVDGRDVDDGPPDTPAWREIVARVQSP